MNLILYLIMLARFAPNVTFLIFFIFIPHALAVLLADLTKSRLACTRFLFCLIYLHRLFACLVYVFKFVLDIFLFSVDSLPPCFVLSSFFWFWLIFFRLELTFCFIFFLSCFALCRQSPFYSKSHRCSSKHFFYHFSPMLRDHSACVPLLFCTFSFRLMCVLSIRIFTHFRLDLFLLYIEFTNFKNKHFSIGWPFFGIFTFTSGCPTLFSLS